MFLYKELGRSTRLSRSFGYETESVRPRINFFFTKDEVYARTSTNTSVPVLVIMIFLREGDGLNDNTSVLSSYF